MEQKPPFVPREDMLCWLFCSLVCIPYDLISSQPPENLLAAEAEPCTPAGAGSPGTAPQAAAGHPAVGGMAVVGYDMGGAPHTGCPVGDSLSGDACVSGIMYI